MVQSEAASDYLHRCRSLFQKLIPTSSGWWFRFRRFFIFLSLTWGNLSNVSNFLKDGLVQPPTSLQIFLCCVKNNKMWFELQKKPVAAFQFGRFWEHEFLVLFLPQKKHVGGDLYQVHLNIACHFEKIYTCICIFKYIYYVYIYMYLLRVYIYMYILCMLLHFELAPVIYKKSQFLTKKHLQQLFPTTLPYTLC